MDFFSCTSQHGAQVNSASRLGFEKKCDAEQVDLCVRPYPSDSQTRALSDDSLQRVLPYHDTFSGKDRLDRLQGHYSDWGSQKLRPTVGVFRSNDTSAHRLSNFTI